jgi:hypothetical protein
VAVSASSTGGLLLPAIGARWRRRSAQLRAEGERDGGPGGRGLCRRETARRDALPRVRAFLSALFFSSLKGIEPVECQVG